LAAVSHRRTLTETMTPCDVLTPGFYIKLYLM
jgi:hypothetical protein